MNTALGAAQTDLATAGCWRALNLLSEQVRSATGTVTSCSLLISEDPQVSLSPASLPAGDGWAVSVIVDPMADDRLPPVAAGESRFLVADLVIVHRLVDGGLPPAVTELLEVYLPYCLAPLHARRMGRTFTVSHFAQSLDGRIATATGDARWIGCEENRLHAHRMRALCDGILIGSQTLRTDRPALTVRHADGVDPIRIVVGDADDLACLEEAGPGPIVLIDDAPRPSSPRFERLVLPREDGLIPTTAILEALFAHGILSVYIEGGAATTSAFLADGNIDVLQLHISPMILASGVNSFTGPPIQSIDDSIRFARHVYRPIGDGVMFVGSVAP